MLRPNARLSPLTNPLRNSQGDAQTVLAQKTLVSGKGLPKVGALSEKRVLIGRNITLDPTEPLNSPALLF